MPENFTDQNIQTLSEGLHHLAYLYKTAFKLSSEQVDAQSSTTPNSLTDPAFGTKKVIRALLKQLSQVIGIFALPASFKKSSSVTFKKSKHVIQNKIKVLDKLEKKFERMVSPDFQATLNSFDSSQTPMASLSASVNSINRTATVSNLNASVRTMRARLSTRWMARKETIEDLVRGFDHLRRELLEVEHKLACQDGDDHQEMTSDLQQIASLPANLTLRAFRLGHSICLLLTKYCHDITDNISLEESEFAVAGLTVVKHFMEAFDEEIQPTQIGIHAVLNKGYLSQDVYPYFREGVDKRGVILAFRGMRKETRAVDEILGFIDAGDISLSGYRVNVIGKPPSKKEKTQKGGVFSGSLLLTQNKIAELGIPVLCLDGKYDFKITEETKQLVAILLHPTLAVLNNLINKRIVKSPEIRQVNGKSTILCQHMSSDRWSRMIPLAGVQDRERVSRLNNGDTVTHDAPYWYTQDFCETFGDYDPATRWEIRSGAFNDPEKNPDTYEGELEFITAEYDGKSQINIIVSDNDLAWYVCSDSEIEDITKASKVDPKTLNSKRIKIEAPGSSFAGLGTVLDRMELHDRWNSIFSEKLHRNAFEHPTEIDTPCTPSSLENVLFLLPGGQAIFTKTIEQFMFVLREIQKLDPYKNNIRINLNWLLMRDISDEAKELLKDIIKNGVIHVQDMTHQPAFFIEQAFYFLAKSKGESEQFSTFEEMKFNLTRVEINKLLKAMRLKLRVEESPLSKALSLVLPEHANIVDEFSLSVERYVILEGYYYLINKVNTQKLICSKFIFPDEVKNKLQNQIIWLKDMLLNIDVDVSGALNAHEKLDLTVLDSLLNEALEIELRYSQNRTRVGQLFGSFLIPKTQDIGSPRNRTRIEKLSLSAPYQDGVTLKIPEVESAALSRAPSSGSSPLFGVTRFSLLGKGQAAEESLSDESSLDTTNVSLVS